MPKNEKVGKDPKPSSYVTQDQLQAFGADLVGQLAGVMRGAEKAPVAAVEEPEFAAPTISVPRSQLPRHLAGKEPEANRPKQSVVIAEREGDAPMPPKWKALKMEIFQDIDPEHTIGFKLMYGGNEVSPTAVLVIPRELSNAPQVLWDQDGCDVRSWVINPAEGLAGLRQNLMKVRNHLKRSEIAMAR